MTDAVQIVAIVISAALLCFVLDLVRRRKLTEEYSFIWIVFALALLSVSIWRESLHAVARWLDVHYPPAVLLAGLILFVFVASLYFSIVISRQRDQLERLIEAMAILEAQHRIHVDQSCGHVPDFPAPDAVPPHGADATAALTSPRRGPAAEE